MSDAVVRADGVWKMFRLYHERNQSLKAMVMRGGRATYEDFWALKDVSFEVPAGSTFGLIGHNGSGKSTMLKTLAKILRPDHGPFGHPPLVSIHQPTIERTLVARLAEIPAAELGKDMLIVTSIRGTPSPLPVTGTLGHHRFHIDWDTRTPTQRRTDALIALSLRLGETPCGPLTMESPERVTRALFERS